MLLVLVFQATTWLT